MNPFTNNPAESIGSLGEIALIERLRNVLGSATPPEPQGMGDDCAVYQVSGDALQLVTSDPVIYGKHFDDALTPEQVAAKLLRRNLSDIAAMGGDPTLAILSLALPAELSIEWIERVYAELGRLATRYQLSIAGGDVSSADGFLGLFLTLIGEMSAGCAPLRRHQATKGCPIYVTGELGGTRLRKHYAFEPRLEEGRWLAGQVEVVSCSDLSDGLGKDIANIIASDGGAELDADALPIAEDAHAQAAQSGKPALYHACNDGEDFELVFALAADADCDAFEACWKERFATPISRIGIVVTRADAAAPRLAWRNHQSDFAPQGYEHFGKA